MLWEITAVRFWGVWLIRTLYANMRHEVMVI